MTAAGKAAAGCLFTLLAIPFGAMLNGYVLSVVWAWFIVPVFGLPEISVAQGLGIALVVGMMTHQDVPLDKEQEWWAPAMTTLVKPLVTLVFASIWKSFL